MAYFEELVAKAGLELVEDIGDVCGQHTLALRKPTSGS
jgi:hypothetical protein